MSAVFSIDLSGLESVQEYLSNLELSESKKQEMLANIGTLVVFQTRERFKTKTAPDGKLWKDWSSKHGLRRPNGKSLLQDNGDLLESIVFKVSGNKLEIGSDEVYSGTHQYGHKNIPSRPYLGINDEDKAEIEAEIIEYLKEQANV